MRQILPMLIFVLTLTTLAAQAQNLVQTKGLVQDLATQQLDQCMADTSTCKGLDSDVIASAIPKDENANIDPLSPGNSCKITNPVTPAEEKTIVNTVLLVAEVNATPKTHPGAYSGNPYYDICPMFGLPEDKTSGETWKNTDPVAVASANKNTPGLAPYADSLLMEGLFQTTGRENLSNDQLAQKLANQISSYAGNDDAAKMRLLSTFSERLYYNYNNKRNPGQGVGQSDVPVGNMSLGQIMGAAADYNMDGGGVCNDISQATAVLGKKLFPDKDVLVINSGTHFVVAVNGKEGTTIIDGGDEYSGVKQTMIPGYESTTNTRIFKMDGDRLREIAVVDNETGAVMKKFYTSESKALLSGTPPSVVYGEYKREVEKANKKKALDFKAGTAKTSNSEMVVFVGQYERTTEKSHLSVGLGGTHQSFPSSSTDKYAIFSFHTGYQHNLIRYQAPTVTVKGSAGVDFDVSDGFLLQGQSYPNVSANLQPNQKVQFSTTPKNPSSFRVNGQVQAVEAFGTGNMGNMGSASARLNSGDILKNLNVHLNQIYATTDLTKPLNSNTASMSQLNYQGSNVGQKFNIMSGIQITSLNGMKIFALVGVNQNFGGYETKNSLIANTPSGGAVTAGIATRNGTKITTNVTGVGNSQGPTGNVTAIIPIVGSKKKLPPVHP